MASARIDADTRILIIGAGVVGAALADDLTRHGMKSVTVVDQGPLYRTGGSSSHAPGFAFQTTGSPVMSELARRTLDKLDGATLNGQWILKRVGGLELACDAERLGYLYRRHNLARSWDVPARMVSADECGKLFPGLDTSTVLGGLHTPTDGVVKAVRAIEWQARRAIENGARFYGHTAVTGFRTERGRVTGVEVRQTPPVPGNPSKGEQLPDGTSFIEADIVVVCAGLWGPGLGKLLGLELPMVPMEHCSSHTSPLPSLAGFSDEVEIDLPMVRHQATGSYLRQMGGRLTWGTYEHRVIPVEQSEIASPEDYAETQVEPAIHPLAWNDLKDGWAEVQRLFPETQSCEAIEGYNGIFSFTPDGNPLLGEVPGINGLWLGESVWLTQSAGVAGVLADWIVTGDPGVDTTSLDFRRFDQTHLTHTVSLERASENYDEVYDISHPRKQTKKLRKLATTPFYVRQEALGAVFGAAQGGWERPLWYGSTGCPDIAGRRRDAWGTYGWSPAISAEARKAVSSVGLVDRGAASVFEVRGSGAEKHLQEILAAGLSLELSTSTGAFVESPSGGIAADLTVVRTAEDAYLVIGSLPEDVWHLRRETPHLEEATVSDVSSATTAVALIGPDAAALLASVTRGGVPEASTEAPVLDVGGVPVRAVAETTTGVGGWTLYAATEHGLYLWDLLVAAAGKQGMALVGDEAVTALRIANGVPAFGIDFGPQDNAYEAGLVEPSAAVDARPGHRLLVRLRLSSDRHAVVQGEPVSRGGRVVGYVTSAAEDPASGRFLALAWVDPEAAAAGTTLEISHLDAAWAVKVDRSPLASASRP